LRQFQRSECRSLANQASADSVIAKGYAPKDVKARRSMSDSGIMLSHRIFSIFSSTALLLRCEIYCELGICENKCNYSCFEHYVSVIKSKQSKRCTLLQKECSR